MREADKNVPKKTGCFTWIMFSLMVIGFIGYFGGKTSPVKIADEKIVIPPYKIDYDDVGKDSRDISIHYQLKHGDFLTDNQIVATYQQLKINRPGYLRVWMGNPSFENKQPEKKGKKAKIKILETAFAICSLSKFSDEVCEIHKDIGAGGVIKDRPEKKVITLAKYEPPLKDERDRSTMAFIQCKNFVKDRLVSPSTADFPFLDRSAWQGKNQVYIVKSYVDAQNAYGAMIRNHWYCKVKYTGGDESDNNSWSLEGIEIN